jgi:hypothetical protein
VSEAVLEAPVDVYTMPAVEVGDQVVWYDSGDVNSNANAAVVTAVNAYGVELRVLNTGTVSGTYKRGVRHITDPKLKINEFLRAEGGWDYSPFMKRVMLLESRMAAVEQVNHEAFGTPTPKKQK